MLSVIFLDIDMVLNTLDFINNHPSSNTDNHIDPDKISILNRIIKATGMKVVISSTWRATFSPQRMQDHLIKFGFIGQVIDNTDDNNKSRFNQIQDWMDNNLVEDFVIIDDDGVMDHLIHMPSFKSIADKHFFQTNPKIGLTNDIADRIIGRKI